MNKTDIEWCGMTWNPVTGCLHGCEYCYARGIAHRYTLPNGAIGLNHDLRKPHTKAVMMKSGACQDRIIPYPYEFDPTFHRYRLGEPSRKKQPQNIFVCSMADLFGAWVPDSWIKAVFEACEAAPQHNYLFLTKNPKRYIELETIGELPLLENFWYGTTITTPDEEYFCDKIGGGKRKRFLSMEPLLAPFEPIGKAWTDWIIIGAESGNRKGKVVPKREWIENIVHQGRLNGVPVFMKNSLAPIWGEPLIQEWPEGLRRERSHD